MGDRGRALTRGAEGYHSARGSRHRARERGGHGARFCEDDGNRSQRRRHFRSVQEGREEVPARCWWRAPLLARRGLIPITHTPKPCADCLDKYLKTCEYPPLRQSQFSDSRHPPPWLPRSILSLKFA